MHERGTFRAFASFTECISNIDGQFADWQVVYHEHKKAIVTVVRPSRLRYGGRRRRREDYDGKGYDVGWRV